MKSLASFLIWSGLMTYATGQTSFTINHIHPPDHEFISDIQFANSRYYALAINSEASAPFRNSGTLSVFNNSGQLTHQAELGGPDHKYFRILSIFHNKLQLIGSIKTDSCSSILTLSEFDISAGTLTHLTQYPICEEKYIHSVRIVPGLDDESFFEIVYSQDEFDQSETSHKMYIMTLDEENQLSLILDLDYWNRHLSVDFSRKGYIVSDAFVYEYYDRNFNHRYQYNNGGDGFSGENYSSHQPLVNHYVLEQVVREDEDHSESESIRLIDSNLHTKKLALINPVSGYGRNVKLPVHGGISIAHYNSIWTAANFSFIDNETPAYFSITRLDSDLKIICTHFLGFDGLYKIYGITAFEENGAIVYGWKKYYDVLHGIGDKNIFALKIGNECELPTTSTNGPQDPLISISVYPNPGINDLTFSVNGFDPVSLRVELIDETGRVLFATTDLSNSIKVPELPSGQYFYQILEKDRLLGVGAWVKQ